MASKRGPKAPLSAAHRAALAAGRNDARVVRAYLEQLDPAKSRRTGHRTPEAMEQRLAELARGAREAAVVDDLLQRSQLIEVEAAHLKEVLIDTI